MAQAIKTFDPITVTESAAQWIDKQLIKRGKGVGIRVSTKESGCTGFKYVLDYVDNPEKTDYVIDQHGVKVFVDTESLAILAGTVLEHKVDGLNSGLDFVNPNVTAQCGCGESFTI